MAWLGHRLHPAGRTSRVGFWRWQAIEGLCGGFVLFATVLVVDAGVPGAVPFLLMAPVLIGAALITIRRMHERGRSGWWVLMFNAIPYSLSGAGTALLEIRTPVAALIAAVLMLGALGFWIWSWLEFGFLRGTRGPNRFGPEPQSR